MIRKEDALEYHQQGRKGKIEISVTKPCATQRDLSLAYTPGVAEPCREIHENPEQVYQYTAKGNLVAVVSNGTAVLGLGNIGPLAGKPVMEGKGVLFKRFADIDVFDIEIDCKDPNEIIRIVKSLEPTFGGINLEDIKAPECFHVEEELKKQMNIPVFHDDQHGTAIISGAALLNALEIVNKSIDKIRVVFCGAGAAGIACAKLYRRLGVLLENMILVDTKGVVYEGRKEGMNPYKAEFAQKTAFRTLAEAMKDADVFVGVSSANQVTPEMVKSMAAKPIVFAMANPDPEITWEKATGVRKDIIMATGRSDYPNQVNNVLGFPFIFRGALDVRASAINEEMKIAAVRALANLAKEDVPDSVLNAYGNRDIRFGPEYIIPKPFDPRVLLWETPAVAKAAMDSGVARQPITDFQKYYDALEARLGRSRQVMRVFIHKAQSAPKRIVFPEGEEEKIIRAAQIILDEHIAEPILLGKKSIILEKLKTYNLDPGRIKIITPTKSELIQRYVLELYEMRKRKGITVSDATVYLRNPKVFAPMMVHMGDADGLVSGITQHFPETIRPALQIIKPMKGVQTVTGVYMLIFKNQTFFIADPVINIDPTCEQLAEIAILAAQAARSYDFEPRVAMLSFSNFGSTKHPLTEKMQKAAELVRKKAPWIPIDGEMQADIAVSTELMNELYPFNELKNAANVLVFPDLTSANTAYKLLVKLGGAVAVGPLMKGMSKPVYLLQMSSDVNDIVNMTALAVMEAQENARKLDPIREEATYTC
ncbi:MAG TPA: NADP-dependent malic enzyme [Acidobacteriota bacterium]|nr:NADP-dependent malic enzyme [Acidobacteriota bacterium]